MSESTVRGWGGFRQPRTLVEETRRLFFCCNFVTLILMLPGPLQDFNAVTLVLATGSAIGLIGSWVYPYLTEKVPIWLDVVFVVCVAGYALACPNPALGFSFAFTSLWFRALYGSNWRIALCCTGASAAMISVVLLWGINPGHASSISGTAVYGTLPLLFLDTAVFRYLVLGMFAREQSQRREVALARLGSQLLGVTDSLEIYRYAGEAVAAFCDTTADLRALIGSWDENTGRVQIRNQAGPFSGDPIEWPFGASLAEAAARESIAIPDNPEFARVAGFNGQWLAIPLPDQPGGWMVLGSPTKISSDVVVAFNSLINQVALALRNSEAHRDLDTQANTDSLTGLMNRAAFTVAVERAFFARPGQVALMFVDLDDFKTINDGLGHAAGDELLRHVAARMRESVRSGDLCARLGGDEFAVLLHDAGDGTSTGGIALIAQRLIDLISSPVLLSGRIAHIGASVGVAHAAPDVSPEILLQRADIAMYAAKAQGKNRFQVFEPGLLQSDEHVRTMAVLGVQLEH